MIIIFQHSFHTFISEDEMTMTAWYLLLSDDTI